MFKSIRKLIYKTLLNRKLRNLEIRKPFSVMEEYGKLYFQPVDKIENNQPEGFHIGDNYDIFYKNVHLRFTENPAHKIFRVSIKKNDDAWRINNNDTLEQNDVMEVYLTYDIEVLGGLRCTNTLVKNGNWDEYVYKTLNEIEQIVNSYTRESNFNKEYDFSPNAATN